MVLGAACGEHFEILVLEALGRVAVGGVEGIYQPVAKGIGVDVEGRVDEMRDIGPERLVAVREIEDGAEALGLHAHPQGVDVVGGQFAAATGIVQFALEIIEGDLADDGVDHVLDLASEEGLALFFGFGGIQQLAEGEHLAKDGCGFCERQGGGGEQLAL